MQRRHIAIAVITGLMTLTVCVGVRALDSPGPPRAPDGLAERQTLITDDLPDVTSSTEWRPLFIYTDHVRSRGLVAITFTAQFHGAPVQVRLVRHACRNDDRQLGGPVKPLSPGRFSFTAPRGHRSTMAATFSTGSTVATCRFYNPEWRSPTGGRVVYDKGSLHMLYDAAG